MIKKLLTILLLALPMVSCSNNKGLTKNGALKELNTFFNSQCEEYKMDLYATGVPTQQLGTFYYDDEKFVITYSSAAKEFRTKDKSYLQGYDFKCYKPEDNSRLFIPPTYINFTKFITVKEFNKETNCLKFDMDFEKLNSLVGIFDNDTLAETLNESGFSLEKMPFEAYFTQDKKLYNMAMILSDLNKEYALLGITIKMRYTILQYGKDFKKKDINTDGFLEVNYYDYDIIENSIADSIQGGDGLSFKEEYFREPFKNEIPQDTVVGYLKLDSISYERKIYFKDLTYDEKKNNYYFYYVTRKYTWNPSVPTLPYLTLDKKETLDVEINHTSDDAMIEDYDNQRILLESNNKVVVLDYSLNIVKQYEVEGTIVKIMNHDDVYHITTVTQTSDTYSINDEQCYGNIYIIDKKTLDIKDSLLDLNCYPCYTVVDKRGDIIISPGCGSRSLTSIYRAATRTLERVEITGLLPGDLGELYAEDYLTYDKENDTVIVMNTRTTGGRPSFYEYRDGKYTARYYWDYKGQQTDFGRILLAYKDYLVASWRLMDVTDWNYPITTRTDDTKIAYRRTDVAFASNDHIYWLQGDYENNAYIQTVELKADGTKAMYQYMLEDKYSDFTFGFENNNCFYLFNNKENTFYEYKLSK